jgi:hypothetical protein
LQNLLSDISLDTPDAAATEAEEAREVLLLEAAIHVRMARMARAQRCLYQARVTDAVRDASAGLEHSSRTYTFVVNYGQNMEIPIFNTEQPGPTYYYSPMSVYNLGVVNHAHVYSDGTVGKHMYAHVYNEAVGKKGANNVASLIVKTLRQLNLLRDDSRGGALNIIFDNCSGQNKNNTVLKLGAWLKAMGYFQTVEFIFLIVGHTKNAAASLFNSLKHEYRKKNLFTMQGLFDCLGVSESVTVVPTLPDDFVDYDRLFDNIYRDLAGKVKQNHIFSNKGEGPPVMELRESNLDEHIISNHVLSKRGKTIYNAAELKAHSATLLLPIKCLGMNPYKMVEMWKNYRPLVPMEYQCDILYAKPDATVMAKVKDEKVYRAESRKELKDIKYGNKKDTIEDMAFGDGDGGGGI